MYFGETVGDGWGPMDPKWIQRAWVPEGLLAMPQGLPGMAREAIEMPRESLGISKESLEIPRESLGFPQFRRQNEP